MVLFRHEFVTKRVKLEALRVFAEMFAYVPAYGKLGAWGS